MRAGLGVRPARRRARGPADLTARKTLENTRPGLCSARSLCCWVSLPRLLQELRNVSTRLLQAKEGKGGLKSVFFFVRLALLQVVHAGSGARPCAWALDSVLR